jgi:hypothetical protein
MAIINASIDLTKIDKSKINNHANGAKYLSISIFINDEPDKYGNNVSIALAQTKEEREAKQNRVYLGNGKTVGVAPAQGGTLSQQAPYPVGPPPPIDEDSLPF